MFAILLWLAACECIDEPVPETTNAYLPLAIGNYWNFRTVGWTGDQPSEHREVVDLVKINGREYYLLKSSSLSGDDRAYEDSTYYRVDKDGFVYVYNKNTELEENRFRLNSNDGDSWAYSNKEDYEVTITVRELTKDIDVAQIANCKDYSLDVEEWVDEEYTYTLAPGIGFLKEFSDGWGAGQVLKSAMVNGKEIKF